MYFPKEFFREEVRDGFTVSEMMKRAWAATLEVLEVIDNVCKEHDIKWSIMYGTLLGAVRHKGFIPWDDDIDIAMLREDFDKFFRVANEGALPPGFVVAGKYAKEERLQKASEVMQSRVMADEEYWGLNNYMNRFHYFPYPRIGIDIFATDNIPKDKKFRNLITTNLQRVTHVATCFEEIVVSGELENKLQDIEKECKVKLPRDGSLKNELWLLADEICRSCPKEDSDYVGGMLGYMLNPKQKYKREWFEDLVEYQFEHITLPGPRNYDGVLSAQFNDYMTPVKMSGGHDYPFYKNQEEEFERMLRDSGVDVDATTFCRNWENLIENYSSESAK